MKKRYLGIILSIAMILSTVTPAMATETTAESTSENAAGITAEQPLGSAYGTTGTEESSLLAADVTEAEDAAIPEADPEEEDISGADDQGMAETEAFSAEPAVDDDSTDNPDLEEESDDLMLLADEPEEDDDDDAVHVTGVTLDKTKLTLETKDQNVQLTATVKPADATDSSVTWSSDKESVATVDDNGVVTAVKSGTATITVTTTDGEFTAECKVTVSLLSDGFHQEPGGTDWCYYKDGKIATGTTDLIQGTVNGTTGYWNVVKGRVAASATVAKGTVDGTNAWWYVNKKGMVDKSYTGFATNSSGSWYAESGKVTKKTNGVFKDSAGAIGSKNNWYYVLNSKVQASFTGLADYKNASGWWYITNGKVDRSVTTVAKNKNGWYYVRNGKVDKSYTGFAKNSSGNWYVKSGKVSKKVNGVLKDSTGAIGSKNSWYYVLNSKVQTGFTGLANYSNASGWWYITNGKVDRSYTGLAKNKNGWYYLTNGKVDRSYTGTAKNSNGWWYVKKGKVDKSAVALVKVNGVWQAYKSGKLNSAYTGFAMNENGMWYLQDGELIRDKAITYAAQIVENNTSSGQSSYDKLTACFNYLVKNRNYLRIYGTPTAADLPTYAIDYFKNKEGDCFSYAAAFAYIAKVLGYEVRVDVGRVIGVEGTSWSYHGWTEVKIDGTWYIWDVYYDSYMKNMSNFPRELISGTKYTLNYSNGEFVWE